MIKKTATQETTAATAAVPAKKVARKSTNFAGPVNVPLILLTHQMLPIGKAQGQDMFKQFFSPLILASDKSASPVFTEPRSDQQFVNLVEALGVLVKADGFEGIPPVSTHWDGFASEIFSTTSHANLIKSMIVIRFMSWANGLTPTVNVSFDHIRIHGIALRHVCDDVWTLTLTFYEEDQTSPWNRGGISTRRLFEVIQPINLSK